MNILRVYEPEECGVTGYPRAWERESGEIIWGGPKVAGSYETEWHPPIKDYIRELAGHRCVRCHHPYPPGIAKKHPRGEWTPCDDKCQHEGPALYTDGESFEATLPFIKVSIQEVRSQGYEVLAHWRILTVHHLNGVKADCRWWNLAALCQRCHLAIQGRVVMERAFILEHSDWFKPYAAGWYAEKYLGELVTREQAMERLEELLALEHVLRTC